MVFKVLWLGVAWFTLVLLVLAHIIGQPSQPSPARGWLVGWLVGELVGWLAGWLAGWQVIGPTSSKSISIDFL